MALPRKAKVRWRGRILSKQSQEAARDGIDETMAAAVPLAKSRTPVVTGTLQGSIRFEPAKIDKNRVYGEWGSFDVNYAMVVEVGRGGRPGRNMLRGAADEEHPKLKQRIAKQFKKKRSKR